MELDHGELGRQIRLGLRRIELATRVEALGRCAGQLASLTLPDVGQLVGEQLVAALGARRVLAAREVDVAAQGERARVVRRRDQVRRVVGVQPRRARRRPDL